MNAKTLLIIGALVAVAYGGWRMYAKGLQGKTTDQLFEMVAQGGAGGSAAKQEILIRAGSGRATGEDFRPRITHASKSVREVACEGCGKVKDFKAVKPLIEALKDDQVEVRIAAAGAFETIRVKEAVEHLLALLDDPSDAVRISASSALRSITGMGYSNKEKDKWRAWWTDNKNTFRVKEN